MERLTALTCHNVALLLLLLHACLLQRFKELRVSADGKMEALKQCMNEALLVMMMNTSQKILDQ